MKNSMMKRWRWWWLIDEELFDFSLKNKWRTVWFLLNQWVWSDIVQRIVVLVFVDERFPWSNYESQNQRRPHKLICLSSWSKRIQKTLWCVEWVSQLLVSHLCWLVVWVCLAIGTKASLLIHSDRVSYFVSITRKYPRSHNTLAIETQLQISQIEDASQYLLSFTT